MIDIDQQDGGLPPLTPRITDDRLQPLPKEAPARQIGQVVAFGDTPQFSGQRGAVSGLPALLYQRAAQFEQGFDLRSQNLEREFLSEGRERSARLRIENA